MLTPGVGGENVGKIHNDYEFEALNPGGRGQKGGLSDYARQMGKQRQNILTYRKGAKVLTSLDKNYLILNSFLDKAVHLATIYSLPRELCWVLSCSMSWDIL